MKRAADPATTNSEFVLSSTKRAANKAQAPDPMQTFVFAALNMSWQLAVVVLVPIILGAQLDKALGTSYVGVFFGLLVAFIGSAFVVKRAVQAANSMPVPKLTAAQKRAVRKAYDEEDDK